jgi:hypothetical protein
VVEEIGEITGDLVHDGDFDTVVAPDGDLQNCAGSSEIWSMEPVLRVRPIAHPEPDY